MRLTKRVMKAAAGVTVAVAVIPFGAVAQDCPAGVISLIEIEQLEVFEVADMEEGSFGKRALGAANWIHMDTREVYVRGELLFEEGSCFDPFLLEESARILRSRGFIMWAEITSETLPDGNVAVHVQVQDDWTLELGLGLSFDEGINLEEILLREANLLGLGITVGGGLVSVREVKETFGEVGMARMFGTAWTLDATGGKTRLGPFVDASLAYPFTSEVSKLAVLPAYTYREDYFPYSVRRGGEPSHVLLPYRRQFGQLTVAYRLGEPGSLWLFGGGFSRENLDFPEFPDGLRVAALNDFSDLMPATEAEQEAVQGQTSPLKATRLNLFAGFRRIDFVLKEGLDAVRAPQDVRVGTEITLSVNPSIPFFEGENDADDVHAKGDVFWAKAPGPWIFSTNLKLEGRYVRGDTGPHEGWRDVLSEVDAKAYFQPNQNRKNTILARVSAARSWDMDRPFQLTLGGREGVRGYSLDAFPGGRRFLTSLEYRRSFLETMVVDLGGVAFGDLGKVWGQDVPYGVDSGWRSSLGFGLRVNTPGKAIRTMRFDFMLPLSGDTDTNGVYFRFYTEIGGLLQFPKRPGQVERSRWSGIETDHTVS